MTTKEAKDENGLTRKCFKRFLNIFWLNDLTQRLMQLHTPKKPVKYCTKSKDKETRFNNKQPNSSKRCFCKENDLTIKCFKRFLNIFYKRNGQLFFVILSSSLQIVSLQLVVIVRVRTEKYGPAR